MCRKEDLENKCVRDQLKYGNRPQSQQNNSDTEEESDNAEVVDVDEPVPTEFLYCYTYDENEFDDRNKADLTCDDDTGDVMYLAICRKEDF